MTIDELIEYLKRWKAEVGGDKKVVHGTSGNEVVGDDFEYCKVKNRVEVYD